ncbi:MAG: manganese efflux pump [Ruminococcaceae bacterium]|nr:manganese efflux pump [Oscillospiraceae bacterium]
MTLSFSFFFNSTLLGVGLAMDAVSVSLANGLNEPAMKKRKMCGIAGVFAFFQALMPLIGWICVHTVAQHFTAFKKLIPWIALALLGFIGGKMLYEGIKTRNSCSIEKPGVGFAALLVQGVATSIDALSVGFTIADYTLPFALLAALIIAAVTFIMCTAAIAIGKKAGTCMAGRAGILGGAILIFIGLEIFITSLI